MKKIAIYILLLSSLASCKKFMDINTDPNNPTDVPPKLILPTTTVGIAWTNGNQLGRAASLLIQHNAGIAGNPAAFDVYNLEGQFDNQWNFELYAGTIVNLRILIAKTEETSPAYSGIAKLQLAYAFSMATDMWGDVPYSEAGYGLELSKPRFDSQRDIYLGNSDLGIQSLFNLVREGLADLDKTSATTPAADDVAYGGGAAAIPKWKRMGNSLLLKLAMQVSNVAPDTARNVINAVIAGNNYINDNTLDFQVAFKPTGSLNQNPIYAFDIFNRPDEEMLSSRFLALMRTLNDTVRLSKLYTKPGGIFRGYENGTNVAAPVSAQRSRVGTYLTGATGEAPIRLLTNFQRLFIMAEAALMLGTTGDPNVLYQDGIRASMAKTGMTTAEITQYFTDNPTIVTLAGTNSDKLRQIITQKYIANVGNGIEAWNDYRRTGFPTLALALNAVGDDPGTIPKRLPYNSDEAARNPNQPNPRPLTNVKLWWGL
jgi:hypothetical protein